MKRKYAAIMLGVTLALSSAAVYAAEGGTAADETEIVVDLTGAEAENSEVTGQVREIQEDTITVSVGTLPMKPDSDTAESEDDSEENTEPGSETEEISSEASESAEEVAGTEGDGSEEDATIPIQLTGEEQAISITENTVVKRIPYFVPEEENAEAAEEIGGAAGMEASEEVSGAADMEASEEISEAADEEITEENEEIMISEKEAEEIDLADIAVGDVVVITLDEDGNAAEILVLDDQPAERMEEEADLEDALIPEDTAAEEDTEA